MTWFRLPPSRPRRRPQELSYAADERPPLATMLTLGFQHSVMALALSAYALALAKGAHLDIDQTRALLAVTIITMAIGTFMQAWGGRFGSGSLMVHMPSPFILPLAVPVLEAVGPGGLVPITIVSAITTLIIAPLAQKLRGLFPPIVAGLVVLIGGLSLIREAFEHSMGLSEDMAIDMDSIVIAGVTLVLIMGLSVWGTRKMRLFALFAGIVGGVITAAFLGRLTGGAELLATPTFALPSLVTPRFDVPIGALIGLAFVALLVQIDSIGSFILIDKMDDADWRRADMKQASRGVLAAGITDFVGGLLGSTPTATSSANIGLTHASGSTTRYAGFAAAGILLLVAFLPKVTLALTLIPTPVIGAIELYAAAFLIASGVDLLASREMDPRGIFIVGISTVGGVGVLLMPGIAENAAPSIRHLVGSGFIVTGVLAILLNLLFRLGIKKSERIEIERGEGSQPLPIQVTDFVEAMGGAWAARRDVVRRAALAAVEASEAIEASGDGRKVIGIGGSFDELNFNIDLVHLGPPLPVGGSGPTDLAAILEGDDDSAIDAAIQSVSGTLVTRLADRLKAEKGPSPGTSVLHLHFDH